MKTFEELGLTFEFDTDCATCNDGSCHNISTSKLNGEEYSVHISTNQNKDNFIIHAYPLSDIDDSEINELFDDEEEAVKFVCGTFNGFQCF